MFWTSNFILGVPKTFLTWFRRWISVVKSCFWASQKVFELPKWNWIYKMLFKWVHSMDICRYVAQGEEFLDKKLNFLSVTQKRITMMITTCCRVRVNSWPAEHIIDTYITETDTTELENLIHNIIGIHIIENEHNWSLTLLVLKIIHICQHKWSLHIWSLE